MVSDRNHSAPEIHSIIIAMPTGLVHTDDRLALLEIARQLNIDSDNEEHTSVSLQISALQ